MSTKLNNDCQTLIKAFWALAILISLASSQPALAAVVVLQEPFKCINQAFITQDLRPGDSPATQDPDNPRSTYLYEVDLSVWPVPEYSWIPHGRLEYLGTPIAVNNLGFRSTDGFLYAYVRNPSDLRQLVKIGRGATVTGLGDAGLPHDELFVAGDISPDGSEMYFVSIATITHDDSLRLYTVPLSDEGPGTATSVEIRLGSGSDDPSINDPDDNVSDWAAHPANGLLYGADMEGELAVLDPATGLRTDHSISGLDVGEAYGAAWFNTNGDLFLYRNSGDIVYVSFTADSPFVESRPDVIARRNDAASCTTGCEIGPKLALCEGLALFVGNPLFCESTENVVTVAAHAGPALRNQGVATYLIENGETALAVALLDDDQDEIGKAVFSRNQNGLSVDYTFAGNTIFEFQVDLGTQADLVDCAEDAPFQTAVVDGVFFEDTFGFEVNGGTGNVVVWDDFGPATSEEAQSISLLQFVVADLQMGVESQQTGVLISTTRDLGVSCGLYAGGLAFAALVGGPPGVLGAGIFGGLGCFYNFVTLG